MKIRDLCKGYQVAGNTIQVLKHLNLDVDNHGITVVLGRSGCGKTTLLRLAAGLEKADNGTVEMEPKTATKKESCQAGPMRMGVIFQEPRLMPWLTVKDNILFGTGKRQEKGTLDYLLELTNLQGFENAYPSQLSGGMQQRAALARALAYRPDYLLMDEPFAALDYFTRRQMQRELLKIHQAEQKGILFVTHSIDEALAIGKKVVILEDGTCKNDYDLGGIPYPRDSLSTEMGDLKREIVGEIEKNSEKHNFRKTEVR